MTELPSGWAEATVGDLIARDGVFVDGDWVESKDQDVDGQVRLTQLADVGDGYWRNRSNRRMTTETAARLGCTILLPGDVLVARMPDPLGRACQFPGGVTPCVTVVDVAVLRPGKGSVRPEWLMWTINAPTVRSSIEALQAGTTRKRISRKNLGGIELPVPPLREQERIVKAIEEAFSKLDAGEAGLRTVRQKLKRMRDAILAAAVSGQLVPQDQTDRPVASFVKSDIAAESEQSIPAGWSTVALGSLLGAIEAGKSFATEGRPANPGETGVIKVSAMTWGVFRGHENKALPLGTPIEQRWLIRGGDLLLSRANTADYVGACVLVAFDHPNLILSDKSLRLVPVAGVNSSWLLYLLRSRIAREQIEVLATGTKDSMRNISQAKLCSLRLPLPPTGEQERIVTEVERQFSVIDACERSVDAGLARSAALRRSVLKAAFEGRLVPQDLSDEPASVLLERIRAERAASGPVKSGRGRKKMETS